MTVLLACDMCCLIGQFDANTMRHCSADVEPSGNKDNTLGQLEQFCARNGSRWPRCGFSQVRTVQVEEALRTLNMRAWTELSRAGQPSERAQVYVGSSG